MAVFVFHSQDGFLNDTSFTPLSTINEDDPDLDRVSKKTLAVLVLLMAGVLVGVIINFVNLHTDFQDLQDFYRGYMGRRMLISEGKLTSRDYINAIKEVNEKKKVRERKYLARGLLRPGKRSIKIVHGILVMDRK